MDTTDVPETTPPRAMNFPEVASTTSAGTEQSAKAANSPLMSTLNKLSHSTSRPDLPPLQGYATRTMRSVSQSLGMWKETSDDRQSSSSTSSPSRRASGTVDTGAVIYPTLENHPEPFVTPLIVLNLAALTAVPTAVTNDRLLDLMLLRLEPWVGEEGEGGYSLVVLAAEEDGAKETSRALPGVAWWLLNWRRIPRK